MMREARGIRERSPLTSKKLVPLLLLATACIGTTGSDIVAFRAFAAGPADVSGHQLTFVNAEGWSVTLTQARLHIGAVYLNRSVPVSGAQERECFLAGVYVAQAFMTKDIDALSSDLQPFDESGSGTADHAITGEVWLTGARIDAQQDFTTIAFVQGTATRGAESIPFRGTVTINTNRLERDTDPARPGKNPLCAQRIVTPIPTSITPTDGGSLVVRTDPRVWLRNVDFGALTPAPEFRLIPDESTTGPGSNFYKGLRGIDAYRFEWLP